MLTSIDRAYPATVRPPVLPAALLAGRVHARRTRGFTLLEILVVVLIVGIMLGLALLAIRDNPEQRLQTEVQRFSALLQLAAQEAVLQSREVAIVIERNGYHFLLLEAGEWVQSEDQVFRQRNLPDDMEFEIAIEGQRLDFSTDRQREPRIYLLSGGEMTPFELSVMYLDRRAVYRVRGDYSGRLVFGE